MPHARSQPAEKTEKKREEKQKAQNDTASSFENDNDDDDDERLNWSDSIEIRRQKKRRVDSGDAFYAKRASFIQTSDNLMMEKLNGRHNICSKNIDSNSNRNLWPRNYLTIS